MTGIINSSSSKLLIDPGSQSSSLPSPSSPSPSSSQPVGSEGSFFMNQDDIFEVQAILDKRIRNKEVQYLIKWKDWDLPQHNTWEGMANLKTVKHLVEEFEIQYKKKKPTQSKPISKKDKKQSKSETQIQGSHKRIQLNRKQMRQRQAENNRQTYSQSVIMPDDDECDIVPPSTQPTGPQVPFLKKKSLPMNIIDLREEKSKNITRTQQSWLKQKLKEVNKANQKQKQKQNQKQELHIGSLSNYYVENGQIYYQVDIIDSKKRIVGVRRVKSEEMRKHSAQSLRIFLEQQLIDIDKYEQMELMAMQRRQFMKNQQ